MAKHKVAELEGALLDFAVARAEGHITTWQEGESVVGRAVHTNDSLGQPLGVVGATSGPVYSPSNLWEQGGPIIARELITVMAPKGGRFDWLAECFMAKPHFGWANGDTPLVAAMRAYVSSKFGEEVELP